MYFTFNRNSNDIVEEAEFLERNVIYNVNRARVRNHKMEKRMNVQ